MKGKFQQWLPILAGMVMVMLRCSEGFDVGITYVQSAVAKGGVCLDGSPPAYHMDRGSGAGINNWLVHFEGGGWCNNATTCLARRDQRLGSSKKMVTVLSFSGMFSNKQKFNPDFYNWNRIKVRYCDGSSYTGDVEAVDPRTKLYYRGARVFSAVIEDLMEKGMKNAQNAMIAGCSAGGLAAILQCDKFKSLFPASTKVKCLADAGFFINAKDVSGQQRIQDFYDDVVATHGSAKNLPQACTSKMKPGMCFFPQHAAPTIRTPLFLVNAAYDSWQIKNILAPGAADPHGQWRNCKTDINKCSASQIQTMQGFRQDFLSAFSGLQASSSKGYYINSCYAHCQTGMQETWMRSDSPRLDNKSIGEAVGDWYYDRNVLQKIDCPYPCDKTCKNRVFETQEQPFV